MGLRFFTPLRYVQNDMVESAASVDSGFRRNDVIDARNDVIDARNDEVFHLRTAQGATGSFPSFPIMAIMVHKADGIIGHHSNH